MIIPRYRPSGSHHDIHATWSNKPQHRGLISTALNAAASLFTYRKVAFMALLIAGTLPVEAGRVYMIGNSITDSVHYRQFQLMAQSRGYTHIWGRNILLGAPLNYIWQHPDVGLVEEPFRSFGNALPNYDWDAITLQTYDSDIVTDTDHAKLFIDLARQRSYTADHGEFFIFARWPRKDKGPFLTYWPSATNGTVQQSENAAYFEWVTANLQDAYPDVSIRMIPVGHVFFELEKRMRDGLVPGYTDVYSDLYSDAGHATDDGAYICALTFFATIYKDDPRGLGTFDFNLKNPAAAPIFQEVVWQVVTSTPLAGVESNSGFTITTSHLPRASVNRPYEEPLRALFGVEPYTWSLLEGTLPPGISLSTNGLLSGTPTTAGDYPIVVQVEDDDGQTASFETTFSVVVNTIPDILTSGTLPNGNQGTPYNLKFTANLGDPPLVWRVTSGSLPLGLTLDPDGRFYGTPGRTGTYNFTVEVADDDFPADMDSAQFSLTIGAPEANTISIPRILQPVTIDGNLNENFWAINQTASRVAAGNPVNQVNFGFAWDIDYLYIGVTVNDSTPNSSREPMTDNDVVQILIDANHDRETNLNVDDRVLTIDRLAMIEELFARGDGVLNGVTSTASGYSVEIAVPWANLQRTPYPGMGVGFDIINRDDPDGQGVDHIKTWNGSNTEAPIPDTFGNLLLSANIAGTPSGDVLIAYEPFGGPVRPLHDTGVPLGWQDVWIVQNGDIHGYSIEDNTLPVYGDHRTSGELLTQGMRGSGGGDYLGVGRRFDLNTAFASYRNGETLGKPGQTLWISWMARLDVGDSPSTFALSDGNFEWIEGDQRITVYATGNQWRLKVNGAAEMNTGILSNPGDTYFFVMKVDFNTTSTVQLYINPTSLESVPEVPTATVQTSASVGFRRVYWFPGASRGNGTLDEIRVGTSYAAVTPIKAYPPIIDIPPQSVESSLGGMVTFSVSSFSRSPQTYQWFHGPSAIPGATESTLNLEDISEEDLGNYSVRIRNASGTTTSPIAILATPPPAYSAFYEWLDSINWNSVDDGLPEADPDNDGIDNRWEYFFGSDPQAITTWDFSFYVSKQESGNWSVTLSPLRSDATFPAILQISSDLDQWVELPENVSLNKVPVSSMPGFEQWQFTLPESMVEEGSFFVRLVLIEE